MYIHKTRRKREPPNRLYKLLGYQFRNQVLFSLIKVLNRLSNSLDWSVGEIFLGTIGTRRVCFNPNFGTFQGTLFFFHIWRKPLRVFGKVRDPPNYLLVNHPGVYSELRVFRRQSFPQVWLTTGCLSLKHRRAFYLGTPVWGG